MKKCLKNLYKYYNINMLKEFILKPIDVIPMDPSELQNEDQQANHQGFTFLEVMIVITLLLGIAAIAGPMMINQLNEANIKTANIQMRLTGNALDNYRRHNFTYPTTEQGLKALREKPEVGVVPKNWSGPYLKTDHPKDPWGNDYIYRSDGKTLEIISLGSDGQEGGEDVDADIVFKQ